VNNYTGQNVLLTPIMSAKDDSGNVVYNTDGSLQIALMGEPVTCKPNPGSQSPIIIKEFYPTYDGFTAKTSDGKYFLTVGRYYSSSPNQHMTISSGTCMTSWAVLCLKKDDGTFTCITSDGTELTDMESGFAAGTQYNGANFTMSSTEKYYGSSGISWLWIIIILVVIVAAIVAAYFGYKKYKSG
jgi:hypothetical protein